MRFLAYHYERKVLYCHCEPAEGRLAMTIYRLFFAKR